MKAKCMCASVMLMFCTVWPVQAMCQRHLVRQRCWQMGAWSRGLCVHASLNASTHAGDADAPGHAPARTKLLMLQGQRLMIISLRKAVPPGAFGWLAVGLE